jgi:NitT/TauT family transport system ATP-binding protein
MLEPKLGEALPSIGISRGSFSLAIPCIPIQNGQIVGIFGHSGCGKTTYLRELSKIVTSQKEPASAIYLSQHDDLLESYSVLQNIEIGNLLTNPIVGREDFGLHQELLRQLGLENLLTRVPRQLSGGQRRRVAIARTFFPTVDFVLLDEPFNGIGRVYEERIVAFLIAVKRYHRAIVVVSHDLKLLSRFADQIVIFSGGAFLDSFSPLDPGWKPASLEAAEAVGVENIIPLRFLDTHFEHTLDLANASQCSYLMFWRSKAVTRGLPGARGDLATLRPRTNFVAELRQVRGQNYMIARALDGQLPITLETIAAVSDLEAPWYIEVPEYFLC